MNIKSKINNIFIKYDIIWAIKFWAPLDEYNLESWKIYSYVNENDSINENDIYNELVKIIEEWFWLSPLYTETLKILKLMSKEIYLLI